MWVFQSVIMIVVTRSVSCCFYIWCILYYDKLNLFSWEKTKFNLLVHSFFFNNVIDRLSFVTNHCLLSSALVAHEWNFDFFIVSFNFFLKFNEYFGHRGNRFQIFVKLPNAFDLRLFATINTNSTLRWVNHLCKHLVTSIIVTQTFWHMHLFYFISIHGING